MKHSRHLRLWPQPFSLLSLLSLFALLLTTALSTPALADPPGRIGRVAWLSQPGSLTLDNLSSGETFRAPLNQPLTSGDVLRTDTNARAEVQIGSMTLRLDKNTVLELSRIDDERVSVFLRNGRSIARLASPESAREFELNTPHGRFTSDDTGIFRVEADNNGSAATAYDGSLRFTANDADIDIQTGERANIWHAGQTHFRLTTPVSDDFTRWSAARDQRPPTNVSSRYVSPEMTGAEDLDAYGDWSDTPDYGPVWMPRAVAVDWAPYRTGHWVWVAPWGWSWVGHEPWGFAPFHYGRWIQYRGRWGWVPGERIARPVYAPAMVTWSSAPGFSVAFAVGRAPTAGWFPLAPREVYVPFYRSSPDYVRRVNRTHVNHIENLNVIVSNPHDFGRHTRYVHRDMRPIMPTKPIVHAAPVRRFDAPPAPGRQPNHRDDDRRDKLRHAERDSRRDHPTEALQPRKPSPSPMLRHPDSAFIQLSQPARTAMTTQREARAPERRQEAQRRRSSEDDPRKRRHHPEADERR